MLTYFENLVHLHENHLWTNLCQVGPMVMRMAINQQFLEPNSSSFDIPSPFLTSPPPSSSSSTSSPPLGATTTASNISNVILSRKQYMEVVIMVADAYFECREFRKAEVNYKEGLHLKKEFMKQNNKKDEDLKHLLNEVEIKYRLHECFLHQQQHKQAFTILQSVPAKTRTPKVNMALGKLYHKAGMERPAITCFREVLKVCPLSTEATQFLLQLGVKAKEIQELTLEMTSTLPKIDWFSQWVAGHGFLASKENQSAIQTFKKLDESENSLLKDELGILVALGLSHYYSGDYQAAEGVLGRVHLLDHNHLSGMDAYAAILCRERKHKELEKLALSLMSVTEEAPEPWIALAYHCYLNKKGAKAIYFSHKACLINPRCVEALILKGNVLLGMKKVPDALSHFKEAMVLTNSRFEIHKGLVECYTSQTRPREAASIAAAACRQLGNTPRALTLFASVLMKDPYQMSVPRAKSLLEKALSADPYHLPAVYMMVELLEQEQHLDQAIELLKSQITIQSSCKLHQMLADLLAKTHDEEKAMEHYTIALNLDPKSSTAQEGIQKIEQSSDGPLESTYDLDMEDMNSEGELEESETEAVWSDGDINLTASNNTSSRYHL